MFVLRPSRATRQVSVCLGAALSRLYRIREPQHAGAGEGPRLHTIDLKTGLASTLADSEELWAPRCSPDGHYIAALAGTKWGLTLYDVATRKQIETIGEHATWPSWSRDGQSLFFIDTVDETHWWRYRIGERKPEPIVSLKKTPVGKDGWSALGLNNTLIATRDTGTDEFYALDWEAN